MRIARRPILAGALGALAAPALAQGWPQPGRPVTIIVPYAPGGSTDTSARLMAAAIERELGVPVPVVNRPGAGSLIGVSEAARARPDGHTLVWAVLPTIIGHYLDPTRRAPYTRESFQPIAHHHFSPVCFGARANGPLRSIADMVEAARRNPEGVSVSTSGLGGTPHLGTLLLEHVTGVRFASVHFNAGPPSATAVVGGHVDVVAGGASDMMPGLRAAELRVLGICWDRADPLLPGVPTLRSQGHDVIMASASGLMGPAGIPMEIVHRLSDIARRALERPEHRERLWNFGIPPTWLDPEAYAEYWRRDEDRMRPLMPRLATG